MIDGDRLPTLDAPRVQLRWLTADDVDALFAVFSDREMMRYWSTPAMKLGRKRRRCWPASTIFSA